MSWGEITAVAALVVAIASALFAFLAPMRAERLRRETAQKERELICFTSNVTGAKKEFAHEQQFQI